MKLLLVAIVLFTTTLNAFADKDEYTILGDHGGASCASYVKEFKSEYLIGFQIWANGYISHFNQVNKSINVGKNVDLTARSQWIYEYCKKNPLDMHAVAVSELLEELIRRQK